jgi:hypothetical protein
MENSLTGYATEIPLDPHIRQSSTMCKEYAMDDLLTEAQEEDVAARSRGITSNWLW